MSKHLLSQLAALSAALVLAIATTGAASAQEQPRTSDVTGYSIDDDAVWSFFSAHGGNSTFGEPISNQFLLFGKQTQLFQNAALQVQADGSVVPLQLTDASLLSNGVVNGLTVPPADPALAFVTPSVNDVNYAARLAMFLQATVPDMWNGIPVGFYSMFTGSGGTDVWGAPTSAPKADPNNPNFVYQRFQNGILFYDASAGTTGALPLGQLLKTQLTTDSPLLKTAAATQSDLTHAF
jgi:hypothetical protein